jgi:hypothetical protein
MKDDRLRSPVKKDYVEALGRAAYTFTSLEWQVVWCAEKIRPGSIGRIVGQEMTAGTIAKKFSDLTRNMPSSSDREALKSLASKFMELVDKRNNIMHGKPCTGPNGEARLSGEAVIEIPDLENAADDFVECSSQLNSVFYGFLQTYVPQSNT